MFDNRKEENLWMAALIDSEGCIAYTEETKNFYTGMTVGNNNIDFLGVFYDTLKRRNYHPWGTKLFKEYLGVRSTSSTTQSVGLSRQAELYELLKELLPYLIVKKEKATKLINFFETEKPRAINGLKNKEYIIAVMEPGVTMHIKEIVEKVNYKYLWVHMKLKELAEEGRVKWTEGKGLWTRREVD